MAITKYTLRTPSLSAWRDLDTASNRFARLFEPAGSRSGTSAEGWVPAMSVEESADELVLTAELPGLTDADVSIELVRNVLTISGEKVETRAESDEERSYHLWERRYGAFRRAFTLPGTVNAEDIRAEFRNGVLTIRLPKVPEAKGRKIEITKG
jgi:HSP20 family protein